MTRVGLSLPQLGTFASRDTIRGFSERAEELGFGSLFVQQHLFYPHEVVSGYSARPGLAVPDAAAAAQQGYQHYYEGEYEDLHAAGLPILAYGAQSGGYFTKRAAGGDLREDLAARYNNPANDARFTAVQAMAQDKSVSVNEVVVAYLLNQPHQTIPIFGASSPEQVRDTVKAANLVLTAQELATLRG